MKLLGLSLLGVLFLTSVSALAQPKPIKPATAFAQVVSFNECSTSWAFACGQRDAQGRTFGTAHQMKHCETYTFQPNGTYALAGDFGPPSVGRYVMVGRTVKLSPINDDGTKGTPFELVLSPDGKKLGGLTRL